VPPEAELLVLPALPQGLAGGEVDLRGGWGLDRYTRRNVWEALAGCRELGPPGSAQLDAARTRFIERHLLPALNRRGDDGW
jgi:hypothetical protein